MSTVVYKNAVLLVDGRSIEAEVHDLSVTYGAEILDRTTFGSDTRVHMGGLLMAQIAGDAWADFGALAPDLLWGLLGTDDKVVSVFPDSIALGVACGYSLKAVESACDFGGGVGAIENLKFAFEGRGIAA